MSASNWRGGGKTSENSENACLFDHEFGCDLYITCSPYDEFSTCTCKLNLILKIYKLMKALYKLKFKLKRLLKHVNID